MSNKLYENMHFPSLRQQKEKLYELSLLPGNEDLCGIVHALDALMDDAAEALGEQKVFGFKRVQRTYSLDVHITIEESEGDPDLSEEVLAHIHAFKSRAGVVADTMVGDVSISESEI